MIAIAGIDGTGESHYIGYPTTFRNSHVKKLCTTWESPTLALYRRGPSLAGSETGSLARTAHAFLRDKILNGEAKAVFLTGYSRGAAAAIEAAHFLKADGIEVEALALFDAVDRTSTVGGYFRNARVPDNVRSCFHAMRDPRSRSRESFSNCGQQFQDPGRTWSARRTFLATHGGLGGVPWPGPPGVLIDEGLPDGMTTITHDRDQAGALEVWAWMSPLVQGALGACKARLFRAPVSYVPSGPYGPRPGTNPVPGEGQAAGPYGPRPGATPAPGGGSAPGTYGPPSGGTPGTYGPGR